MESWAEKKSNVQKVKGAVAKRSGQAAGSESLVRGLEREKKSKRQEAIKAVNIKVAKQLSEPEALNI